MTGNARVRVLVADLDRWTRVDLSTMLDEAGFWVEQASNGVAAIRIAEIAQPQIVVLRHNLPEIGAADVLHILRNDRRTRHCAVLQVQDGTSADDELDSDGRLNLPCDAIELLSAVVSALETRGAVHGSVARRQVEPDFVAVDRVIERFARSMGEGRVHERPQRAREPGRVSPQRSHP